MQPRKAILCLFGGGKQRLAAIIAATNQLELGRLANPQIIFAESHRQLFNWTLTHALRQDFTNPFPERGFGGLRVIYLPNPSPLARTVHPIRNVKGAVGTDGESSVATAPGNLLFIVHFESSAFGTDLERRDISTLGEEEEIAVFLIEGGARIVGEAARPIGITGKGRHNEGCLPREAWTKESLLHPDVVGFFTGHLGEVLVAVPLPMQAPCGHAAFHNVNESLAFAPIITVIVHAEEVAELVEDGLLSIAHPQGKDLQAGPIGFASHDGAAIGIKVVLSILAGCIDPLVCNRPIDSAVWAHGKAGHVVPSLPYVDGVSPTDEGSFVGCSVAVGILVFPDVRLDCRVGRSFRPQDTGGNPRQRRCEILVDRRHLVCLAVAIGVLDSKNLLRLHGEITPITLTVGIAVWRRVRPDVRKDIWPHGLFVKRELVLQTADGEIMFHPSPVVAQVQAGYLAATDTSDVGPAFPVEANGNWTGNEWILRPY